MSSVATSSVDDDPAAPSGASVGCESSRRAFPRLTSHQLWSCALAVGLPLALYLVLRPEPFGLVPNGLDPWFYTGYAINFDDIFRDIGDGHYFVSRWSAYLPARLFTWVAGPQTGRLLLRWLLAVAMIASIWGLGRRWAWPMTTKLVVAVVVLTTPIFARAFLTDYVEWVVASVGFILVCQCLETRVTALRSALIGVLVAVIVIANPLAVAVTVGPTLAYVSRSSLTWSLRIRHAGCAAAAAVVTVASGWLYFRVAYGMPNLYRPTVEFVRDNTDFRDPLKSPQLTWMGAFTWIYVPILLCAAAGMFPAVRSFVRESRAALAVFLLLGIQYAMQWIDQFVRNGNGLEISYYWSFIYPALGVALATFVGALRWSRSATVAFVAVWWFLLAAPSIVRIEIPAGWAFGALAIAMLIGLSTLSKRLPQLAVAGMMFFLLVIQIAAPGYDPAAYHPYNLSPRYHDIYYNSTASGEAFDEAIWLEGVLDTLPADARMYFLGIGAADPISAIYGPQPMGRSVRLDADGVVPIDSLNAIAASGNTQLVVYGPPDVVDQSVAQVIAWFQRSTVELERSHDDDLGFKVVVVIVRPSDL